MTSQKMSQVGEMASKLKMMSNPQTLLNNPQIAQVIKQYGNPKAAFYEIAKQKGINPDDIIKYLK